MKTVCPLVPALRPAGGLGGGASGLGLRRGVRHQLLLQVQEHLLQPGDQLAAPAEAAAGAPAAPQRPLQLLLRRHEQAHPQVTFDP